MLRWSQSKSSASCRLQGCASCVWMRSSLGTKPRMNWSMTVHFAHRLACVWRGIACYLVLHTGCNMFHSFLSSANHFRIIPGAPWHRLQG
ncbi:hypothetical protein XENOCAPTIV_026269 [Xenoophorus captivus]|uniref:Secreted protein n=1 Tax=Xenoophorus captivus TaxID=1517983 RepID=A0ABV0QKU3_9TELE